MAVQKFNVLVPPMRSAPAAAAVIADAVAWLFSSHPWLQRRIATVRSRVAAHQREQNEARSRGLLVAMARRYEATQPGFAKDLYAAAADRGRD